MPSCLRLILLQIVKQDWYVLWNPFFYFSTLFLFPTLCVKRQAILHLQSTRLFLQNFSCKKALKMSVARALDKIFFSEEFSTKDVCRCIRDICQCNLVISNAKAFCNNLIASATGHLVVYPCHAYKCASTFCNGCIDFVHDRKLLP